MLKDRAVNILILNAWTLTAAYGFMYLVNFIGPSASPINWETYITCFVSVHITFGIFRWAKRKSAANRTGDTSC